MKNKIKFIALFFSLLGFTVLAQKKAYYNYLYATTQPSSYSICSAGFADVKIPIAFNGDHDYSTSMSMRWQFILRDPITSISYSLNTVTFQRISYLGEQPGTFSATQNYTIDINNIDINNNAIPLGTYKLDILVLDGHAYSNASEFPLDYSFKNNVNINTCSGTLVISPPVNCTLQDCAEITLVPSTPLTASVSTTGTTCGRDDGTASVSGVAGGTAPYTYSWNTSPVQTTAAIANLAPGTYNCTVKDACGNTTVFAANVGGTVVNYDYANGVNVTSTSTALNDLNGDGIIKVRGFVTIAAGVNYTISNKKLQFNSATASNLANCGIIVNEGATLNINFQSVLRGLTTCGSMWGGIQVLGTTTPGKLNLDDATIQDAYTGVLVKNEAQLDAVLSRFYNNGISINIDGKLTKGIPLETTGGIKLILPPIVNGTNRISRCEFLCNAPLLDAATYAGGGSQVFVRIKNRKVANINSNTFTGNLAFAEDKRATAILGENAKYTLNVDPFTTAPGVGNIFKNLTRGIDHYGLDVITGQINVHQSQFMNVQQSITVASANFGEIDNNSFAVPNKTGVIDTYGIYTLNAKGFTIHNNNLSGTDNNSWGIIVRDASATGAEVRENKITGLSYAAQTEGNNNALLLACNELTNTNAAGNSYGLRVNIAGTGTINDMGSGCGSNDIQADNLFNIGNCSSNKNHIASGIPFTYYQKTNTNPAFALATCTSPIVTLDGCISSIQQFDCAPGILCMAPDCFTEGAPPIKRDLMRNALVRFWLNAGNEQKAIEEVQKWNTVDAAKMLAATYLNYLEFDKAEDALALVPTDNQDNIDFHRVRSIELDLYRNNRDFADMSSSQRQEVEQVAAELHASAMPAQAMLVGAGEQQFERRPEQINDNAYHKMIQGNNISSVSSFKIAPNPANMDVTINIVVPDNTSDAMLTITDLTGRTIQKMLVTETGNISKMLDLKEIQNGIYLCNLFYNGKLQTTEKLVITK